MSSCASQHTGCSSEGKMKKVLDEQPSEARGWAPDPLPPNRFPDLIAAGWKGEEGREPLIS